MGDAALSFHATTTIPVGLLSKVSANVTVVVLPFCYLGCVVVLTRG